MASSVCKLDADLDAAFAVGAERTLASLAPGYTADEEPLDDAEI